MKLSTITVDGVRYVRAKSLLGEAAAIQQGLDELLRWRTGPIIHITEGLEASIRRLREAGGES